MDFEKTETGICNGQMIVLMLALGVSKHPGAGGPLCAVMSWGNGFVQLSRC